MTLIAHSKLPTFERLRAEGVEVLAPGRAEQQDIRELHIGILNLMPDAALEATERQFMRMVGGCNRIAQFKIHLFSVPEFERSEKARAHIEAYYETFERIKRVGLDALIITGANPVQEKLEDEPFWNPMIEIVEWAKRSVSSVMCSCLATHAIVQHYWGIKRYRLEQKRWGVYSHRIVDFDHPLVANINTRFDAPHSHVYETNSRQFRDASLRVLVSSEEADFHLATSEDGFRFIFFQGHPEYDAISLFKEYKREVSRFVTGHRKNYPLFPEHYFSREATLILNHFRDAVLSDDGGKIGMANFPEQEVIPLLDDTWGDTGKAVVNNWLGLVYQLTSADRHKAFMDGVDPESPLG
ncbi:MAG: homoserine O-succinyltransferase [Proteobacteria bacterium]|nr:homoserine O-succinyltransferase [Pseudomonadota bacterium]